MKSLAEYVMRGRMQALWVAVISAGTVLFSWVGAAVIALVTLRKGVAEGGYLMLWAVLPASVVLYMGEIGPFGMIVGTTVLAIVLRQTVSWQATLVAAAMVGGLTGILLMTVGAAYLEQLAVLFQQFFAELERGMAAEGGTKLIVVPPGEALPLLEADRDDTGTVILMMPGAMQIAGILGLMNAMSCVMCLVLARWWQSLLYNPGGFGIEFRSLRLSPTATMVLLAGGVGLAMLGTEMWVWAALFVLPSTIAGIALVHHRAHRRGGGAAPLIMFYGLWLFLDLAKAATVLLAVVDSFVSLRGDARGKDESE